MIKFDVGKQVNSDLLRDELAEVKAELRNGVVICDVDLVDQAREVVEKHDPYKKTSDQKTKRKVADQITAARRMLKLGAGTTYQEFLETMDDPEKFGNLLWLLYLQIEGREQS